MSTHTESYQTMRDFWLCRYRKMNTLRLAMLQQQLAGRYAFVGSELTHTPTAASLCLVSNSCEVPTTSLTHTRQHGALDHVATSQKSVPFMIVWVVAKNCLKV